MMFFFLQFLLSVNCLDNSGHRCWAVKLPLCTTETSDSRPPAPGINKPIEPQGHTLVKGLAALMRLCKMCIVQKGLLKSKTNEPVSSCNSISWPTQDGLSNGFPPNLSALFNNSVTQSLIQIVLLPVAHLFQDLFPSTLYQISQKGSLHSLTPLPCHLLILHSPLLHQPMTLL